MTPDQVREINAITHIENELIDDACGQVLGWLEERGWMSDTDIFFTTDHGELQGDFGLLFKGPYHVDALMRLPFIWRPAGGVESTSVSAPVGHLDLAPTFCEIAGIEPPEYLEGRILPVSNQEAQGRDYVLTEWDSEHGPLDMHLKSIYRDGWLCTTYEKSTLYEGTEGELYNLQTDPEQRENLWSKETQIQAELVEAIYDWLPQARNPRLERKAPV